MRKASEEILNKRKQTASSKSPVSNQASSVVNNAKNNTALLAAKTAVTPAIARTSSLGASFTPPKINTYVEPAKEYLSSPSPQQVIVVNQNAGNINQNVSDRLFAHAITGGLGVGNIQNG